MHVSHMLEFHEMRAHSITVNDAPVLDAVLYSRNRVLHFKHETVLLATFYVFINYARHVCVYIFRTSSGCKFHLHQRQTEF